MKSKKEKKKKEKESISMTEELHRNQRSGVTYARAKFKTRDSLDQE